MTVPTLTQAGWQLVVLVNDSPNPIIATRESLDGGTARMYADGMVDAIDGDIYSISPGFDSFDALEAWIADQLTQREVEDEYGRVEDEYELYLATLERDEQAEHEAEAEYLATCYGYQMSMMDESTADDPEVY